MPASLLPCVNCHGGDGRGKVEAGVTPPDIRWDTLTKPYPIARPGGRTSEPYTERTLIRAIAMGLDSSGNLLDRAMPRYRLSQRDASDLVAYLKILGSGLEPGLTASTIDVGVILPPPRAMGGTGAAIERALAAYFEELNDSGGIYNRRIAVRFADPSAPDGLARLRGDQVFAVAASFVAGVEDEVARLSTESGVPIVGAFTLDPRPDPGNRIFYADAGLPGQAESLAAFAARRRRDGRLVVVHSSAPVSQRAAESALRTARVSGWTAETMRMDSAGDAQSLATLGAADAVMFLSLDGSPVDFLRRVATASPRAALLVPGPLTSKEIFQLPASLTGRVFVAFGTLPSDRTTRAMNDYERMAATHGLPREGFTEQIAALSWARVLTEALQRAGHRLTREKLIAAIESLREFSTGLAPPITCTPSRRIGVTGAHVVTLDLKSAAGVPESVWIDPK